VTRHPIYTGLLGMLLGATLLSGVGQWMVLFPVGLILFEIKIRMEEHLMLATFPEKYPSTADRCHSSSPVCTHCVKRHSANP
jgi:protein-S-isoprenylcysteine O-methyltransferase Ste14